MHIQHEYHVYNDLELPIIFGTVHMNKNNMWANFHEGIEIINILSGSAQVLCNSKRISVNEGDTVIINSNNIHLVNGNTQTGYYSYICPDSRFFKSFGVDVTGMRFQNLIRDPFINESFRQITEEFCGKEELYRFAVKIRVAELLLYLCRKYKSESDEEQYGAFHRKLKIAQQTINHVMENYSMPLTLESISDKVGYSKYYLCRIFRETTGQSLWDFINTVRCNNARILLSSGSNVSESARQCGFCNVSYFCKQYKKYMGMPPSFTVSNPETDTNHMYR